SDRRVSILGAVFQRSDVGIVVFNCMVKSTPWLQRAIRFKDLIVRKLWPAESTEWNAQAIQSRAIANGANLNIPGY
ncbi:MAG: hypothetical protein AAFX95_00770, partial [Cyanobacteria bacterium J06639_16]